MTFSIRRAVRGDEDELVSLSIATFTETFGSGYPPEDLAFFLEETYTPQAYARLIDGPETAIWIGEEDGLAIGYVLAGPCSLPHEDVGGGDGEIKRLYVSSEYQGGGRGTALFETAMSWLLEDGPRTLWLGVWSENHGAQQLYRRYGFDKVGDYNFIVGSTKDHEYIFRR